MRLSGRINEKGRSWKHTLQLVLHEFHGFLPVCLFDCAEGMCVHECAHGLHAEAGGLFCPIGARTGFHLQLGL